MKKLMLVLSMSIFGTVSAMHEDNSLLQGKHFWQTCLRSRAQQYGNHVCLNERSNAVFTGMGTMYGAKSGGVIVIHQFDENGDFGKKCMNNHLDTDTVPNCTQYWEELTRAHYGSEKYERLTAELRTMHSELFEVNK
ncbi:hypothetical protein A3J41_01125 [candidate division TM6 bacterium RIFCSPHIGHO2_12_FULL_38_8]|nr:MAG: hypothetical protein A3J41_01125 [candidate division TM6 bacterium RIFCSPHIGHO2_12_FULL_38_8]